MTIKSGSRLRPYEILAPLVAGGMGVVYLANDSRLDRNENGTGSIIDHLPLAR